ncbi:tyrosine-type recombinase/integrase [Nocardiopsis dassonvillei]|uniref:tyrosine-type recombinase/integrase n=1 Tax=Nocardiopsis dassonvillei TaxID=2014 RepID=UPI0033CF6290
MRAARSQERVDGRSARRRWARDACLLLVGWDLMLRRSELAALRLGDIRWHELGMEVAVRRPKTTADEVWQVVRYRMDPELCAVRAVRAWTEVLAEGGYTAAAAPLLCRLTRTDALPRDPKPLSPHAVNAIVGAMAERAGLTKQVQGPAADAAVQKYTGHSLRRGPITAAARAGASREQISRRSGHVVGSHVLGSYVEQGSQWDEDPLGGVL